jgi:hypothetical protein
MLAVSVSLGGAGSLNLLPTRETEMGTPASRYESLEEWPDS